MIGDTTGGCEPIYDVAYYKNVSGDVQGDEMLVEFDDYFLRTLKANNIDIDPVKEEAEKMMSNNNFEGVDSLETVPDAIGELFITTSDLSALEHARVQCALQDGVDSAISKTVNAPEDATPEDAQDAFMEVYDKGGKGVTYYRDGTRSKQVLTTREDNQGEDEEQDPVDLVKQKLESGELDASDLGLEQDKSEEVVTDNTVEPKSRPKSLVGVTKELDTRYGDLFVTINETEEGVPFEVFANIGKSGGYTESFTESTARLISLCLRCGIKPETIIDQIEGIRSPRVSWDQGDQIYSVPDGIALALRRYSNEDHQVETVETDEDLEESESDQSEDTGRSVIDSGENPECPKCSSLSLYYSEGCKTCESCGWSEC
jgi:ribonucleoside-diphosphate reductase alpha chain